MSVSTDISQLLQTGLSLERSGQFMEAYRHYQRALRLDKKCVEALTQLGMLELRAGQLGPAITYFRDAAKAAPNNPAILNNLAKAYLMRGRPEKALPHLAEAYSRAPNSPQIMRNLGECHMALGNADDSIRFYDAVIAQNPDDEKTLVELARACQAAGNRERAEAIYRDLIERQRQLAEAWSGLSKVRTYSGDGPEVARIQAVIDAGGESLQPFEKRLLHFAKGKVLDDQGRYDEAFDSFRKANALAQRSYDPAEIERALDETTSNFDREFFAERADFGSPSERSVFIFGMPRSGSTLFEQILGAHPQICGAGELAFFRELGTVHRQGLGLPAEFAERLRRMTRRDARRHADEYVNVLDFYSRDAARVTDKMPQNFLRLGWIALLFPKSTFIHCMRDPMDTCVSCYVNTLSRNHTYASDLEALGHYYRHYVAFMDHWKRVLPVDILEIRYEDLVTDREAGSRRLVALTGLEWDDACLSFSESKRVVRTLSAWQVRQPVYRSSIGAWRRFESHLDPLKEALGDLYRGDDPIRPAETGAEAGIG